MNKIPKVIKYEPDGEISIDEPPLSNLPRQHDSQMMQSGTPKKIDNSPFRESQSSETGINKNHLQNLRQMKNRTATQPLLELKGALVNFHT